MKSEKYIVFLTGEITHNPQIPTQPQTESKINSFQKFVVLHGQSLQNNIFLEVIFNCCFDEKILISWQLLTQLYSIFFRQIIDLLF